MIKNWKLVRRWAVPVMVMIAIFLLMKFVFLFGYVPTESMEPTLPRGSYIIGIRVHASLETGDVIIFEYGGKLLVKRIAAVSGDIINLDELTYMASLEQPDREDKTLMVPEGCYFVLGDNTQNSYDSRYWDDPFVREADIVAKLVWPSGQPYGRERKYQQP
ncbi:MAG: signal peptidase I [Lachnospiraceae bacterium]|nr:signal peptidase I [Lachnospiraceae bacterium]